ncbi:MAG: carbonic anhydrase [Acidobacteriaceae bacterium]|nr:carbonic anhydrase [Acidobacteriaceae bacterium]
MDRRLGREGAALPNKSLVRWRRNGVVWLLSILASAAVSGQQQVNVVSADQALTKLMEGNDRYSRDKEQHPDETLARRRELENEQHPFAVILSCSDSRVPPELIFDEGLGDLFVIRVAGNIVDDAVLGSIEYAVEHLHTKLIVVAGHEKCGAVSAAVAGANDPGHLKSIVAAIQASVEQTRNLPGDKVHNCVRANAIRSARQIRESEPLRELLQKDGAKVIAADYSLDSGRVTLLDESRP